MCAFGVALLVSFTVAMLAGWAMSAHCAYCPAYPCYSTSACGGECVCLQSQSWKPGRCVYISPYGVPPWR